ncbi:MAG: hypothetical protein KA257_07060 [Opitutaceae bacterium]|nr:hypothetical protein [Opitutaceae bacterium]
MHHHRPLHSGLRHSDWPHARVQGSLLIVAMILCAVIGICLVSYMKLGRAGLEVSNRALYNNAAMNLAENGLEEAVYSVNKKIADTSYSWPNWSAPPSNTTDLRRQLPISGTYALGSGATGIVRVYIYNYASSAPTIVARSTVTLRGASSTVMEKWVKVQLRKTSKFANGLVAKDSIRFSGNNASVDSFSSTKNDDGSLRAFPVPYSAAVKHDKGSVGSISVAVDAVLVQNADIWGYAATGSVLPSVGSNGVIGPFGTPSGTMDMSRVSTDFSASFDPVSPPATAGYALGSIGANLNLPRAADVAIGGVYYYTATDISFNNKTLAIQKQTLLSPSPNVIITLTDTSSSINIGGGSGALNIQTGSTLQIYAPGDIKIAGSGVMNGGTTALTANQASSLQIWGTKTSGTQDIQIAGNGALSAVVYAPQGSVKINGNGDVVGSVVANDITVVGNAAFHYDEALGDFDGINPFRVSLWQELTSASSRATYSSRLAF